MNEGTHATNLPDFGRMGNPEHLSLIKIIFIKLQ